MTSKKWLVTSAIFVSLSTNAADLVVISNPAVGPLSKDQVSDLYLGKSVAFTLYDHTEGTAAYTEFYKKATGRDLNQVKAIWSRITFSGKGVPPKQFGDDAAVKKAVAADPNGVGYINKSMVDSSVKVVLSLD